MSKAKKQQLEDNHAAVFLAHRVTKINLYNPQTNINTDG